jgi:hypothetical protein
MFLLLQFMLFVWQLVSGLKGELETALNVDNIWYEEWLTVSGICKGICISMFKVFTCFSISSYFYP